MPETAHTARHVAACFTSVYLVLWYINSDAKCSSAYQHIFIIPFPSFPNLRMKVVKSINTQFH